MIEDSTAAAQAGMTLKMVKGADARMAGAVPVWTGAGGGSATPAAFRDFLDVINPLQHIPIVSTIYQNATGDRPSPEAQVIGGALYGGVVGAAMGLANAAVQSATGKDIGGNVLAMVTGDKSGAGQSAPAPASPAPSSFAGGVKNVADIEPAAGGEDSYEYYSYAADEDSPQARMGGGFHHAQKPPVQMAAASAPATTPAPAQDLPGTAVAVANLRFDNDGNMLLTPPSQKQPVTRVAFNDDFSHLNN